MNTNKNKSTVIRTTRAQETLWLTYILHAVTIVLNKLGQRMNINDNVQWSVLTNIVYLQARWPVPAERAPVRFPQTLHNTGHYSRSIPSSFCWGLDTDSTQTYTQTHINNPRSASICFARAHLRPLHSQENEGAVDNTHVCLTVWLGEQPQVMDSGGCNAGGWGVSGLDPRHTPPPHRAWGGAGCARQRSSKEEGDRSVRKRQKGECK